MPLCKWSKFGEAHKCSAYEIVLGTVIGVALGWSARKVMQFSEQRKYIDRQSFVAQYVSLALLSMGRFCSLASLTARRYSAARF
jgi:NhaP-type Na+/H+ or K+/H+ antiporter